MLTVILSVVLCAAVSILVSTIITCKVAEKIYHGALEYMEKIVGSLEEDKK